MPFSDLDFIALNLPPGTSFAINGVSMTVAAAAQNALDEVGTREGALAVLFAMLESDNLQAETIGKYSYSKYQMRGSDYWAIKAASAQLSSNPPNVTLRPRGGVFGSYWRW